MAEETSIRFAGAGGQGLILCARVLADALAFEGKLVAQSQSYEPTSRGELSRSDIVVGDAAPDYPLVTKLDYLVVLDQVAARASDGLLGAAAQVLIDERNVPEPPRGDFAVHALPLRETALALGNEQATNIVALGALAALSGVCALASLEQAIRARVPEKFRALNLEAAHAGFRLVAEAATASD